MNYEFDTIPQILAKRVEVDSNRAAIHIKRDGTYTALSWNDVFADVMRYAATMDRLGVQPGDRVVQYSENRYEWIITDLAIQAVQAIHVPIHAPLTGKQAADQINDCQTKLVFVSTAEMLSKIEGSSKDIDSSVRFVSFENTANEGHDFVQERMSLDEVIVDDADRARQLFEACLRDLKSDSLATILYTSGTTGEPKGVMLSQSNLVTNSLATGASIDVDPGDLRLNFLPLSHIFARTCDMYTWLAAGSQLALAESRETVIQNCQEIHPTILNAVPYFYELVRRAISANPNAGKDSLRNLLGGRIRMCCSGGAALPDHLYDFFSDNGVPLLQGYGLTESSPVITVNSTKIQRRSAVGKPIADVEIAIADDGEVLSRGPQIMQGYWRKPEATAEVIRDGWFHTGDLGRIDEDGFLYITGRKKELIVTAAGKNVAPVLLESLLTEDPAIAQALVIGDDRSYLTALIVPDTTAIPDGDSTEETIERAITSRLANVSHHEQVRKFTLIAEPFTIERGEMTPKLSLRRKVIEEHYAKEIEQMYAK
ncbi:MAG: long-chain fatty acid--CoA ligase [Planctomycetales bacterium]|nr:long-chain fatty acid--CoA ligase [Planctomycetales bacterium]